MSDFSAGSVPIISFVADSAFSLISAVVTALSGATISGFVCLTFLRMSRLWSLFFFRARLVEISSHWTRLCIKIRPALKVFLIGLVDCVLPR